MEKSSRTWAVLGCLILLLTAAACGTATPKASPTAPASSSTGWVKDTVQALNIFLPDADSDYYFDGFGTKDGARTVITGEIPHARYWSFTTYPFPAAGAAQNVHDTDIAQSDGHYTVTIAASCAGIRGTCLATSSSEHAGVVVLRFYVPVDVDGAGTGGVPLPTISYTNASGATITSAQASGTQAIENQMNQYQQQHGALPPELTRTYPPPAPVPTPVVDPAPTGVISQGTGLYANPDNLYEHVTYTTTRGDLVISAQAPTYQADSFRPANDLARPASESPQVRYWSLCVVLEGRHTGSCLRDSEIRLPAGGDRFTVILAPSCPVAGYLNCIPAGPEPLQSSVSARNLLPSPAFAPTALRGPYGLSATYVARPG